jgi:hypothetical protein
VVTSEDTPQFRRKRSRIAAYVSAAKTEDRAARTWPARKAAMDRFEHQVPERKLTTRERSYATTCVEVMQRLALKSVAARQRRKQICQTCGQAKEPEAPLCPKCCRPPR